MSYLEWSERYSVKVAEIDGQHRQLVALINRLHEAMLANRGREVHKQIVAELLIYAEQHFATEEAYMERFGFPGLEAHRQEHRQFAVEAADIKGRLDNGLLVLSLEILTLLKEWLQNHILGTDQQYADCFRTNGLA